MMAARRWRVRLVVVFVAAVLLPAGAALAYQYPPSEYHFYPPCLLHALTGFHCPGCGTTRAVGALVRGDLPQAIACNALFVVSLPLMALGLFAMAFRLWTGRRLPLPRLPGWAVYALLAIIVLFGVLRNVGVYPLTLLAPHAL